MNIVFLHGLFGSPDNWQGVVGYLDHMQHSFHIPHLPIDDSAPRDYKTFGGIDGLTEFVEEYIYNNGLEQVIIGGNSLGGQIAINYAARNPHTTKALILTGSAGLYERSLNKGSTKAKRSYEEIASIAAEIFYDKDNCTQEIIDTAYRMLTDRQYARFLIKVAKATRDHNVESLLDDLNMETLLVWGRQDVVTPEDVAKRFHAKIKRSELIFIEECGHCPPLEKPLALATIIEDFLNG